jgi:hypothetical protein
VIETAFGNDEHELASVSQHLCPSRLGQELAQLEGSVDVHITHIKPGEVNAVMAEVMALTTRHRLTPLRAGELIELG